MNKNKIFLIPYSYFREEVIICLSLGYYGF